MDEREIAIWSVLSTKPVIEAVTQVGHDARDAWLVLIREPDELRALHVVCCRRFCGLTKPQMAEIAASAAIETAIIFDLHPKSVDQVIRRPRWTIR